MAPTDHVNQNTMETAKLNERIILHLCSWYPNRVVKNDGNFIQKQILAVAGNEKHHILAVYEDPKLSPGTFEIFLSQDQGINEKIIYFGKSKLKWMNTFNKLYYFYSSYRAFVKQNSRPVLIHAHNYIYAGLIAGFINIFHKVPYILTEHSSFLLNPGLPWISKWLLGMASKKAGFILPVSDHLQKAMISKGFKGNFRVIGNVVDCNIFKPLPETITKKRFEFLHISGFSPEKNLTDVLKAVQILSRQRDDFVFRIAGDGDPEQVLKLISGLNMDPKFIELSGEKTEDEVARLMQTCDVFVMYSHFETFSIVTAEALAVGKPVIFSDIEARRVFAKSGGLIVVKPCDPDSLARKMHEVINGDFGVEPEFLHNFIRDRFSQESIASQLKAIYEEMTGNENDVEFIRNSTKNAKNQ